MNVIVAYSKSNRGIGSNNQLPPWNLQRDLARFRQITKDAPVNRKNVVVMGRKTWESLPKSYRPLKGRINIVLTRNTSEELKKEIESHLDTYVYHNFGECMQDVYINRYTLNNDKLSECIREINEVFVVGGESIYREALQSQYCHRIIATEVYKKYECDTFFPEFSLVNFNEFSPNKFNPNKLSEAKENEFVISNVSEFMEENGVYYRYVTYHKYSSTLEIPIWRNQEEQQYLDCLHNIVKNGIETEDRTNVGTYSLFAQKFSYNLQDTFPALTTRRCFFRGIFEELMFYISGKTDNTILTDKNIHVWDGNTTRKFLDKRGLSHYPEGDLGETYGFNYRHYGANYIDCKQDYTGQGFDQLAYVIDLIKNNPNSRRMLINLWNPGTLHKAALPACMMQYQFYVDTKKNLLNLQVYIRSSDFFLANNWNACTAALLVHMICNLEDVELTPGTLSVVTGDTHVYKSHLDQVNENLRRTPKPFPKLVVNTQAKKIEDYVYANFKLVGYYPDPSISAPMAV